MFKGVITALVTPLRNDRVDEEALRRLVDEQIANGIDGLVPVGTTGESPTLTNEEHIRVVEIVVQEAKKRVPVIAGTGANSTKEAIELTLAAKAVGADASLQVTPYYNKPTQDGLYRHFKAIAEAVDIPMILYNVPGRTVADMATDTTLRLAQVPGIVGIKDATGNLDRGADLLRRKPAAFMVFSGDDATALPYILLGANGDISVTANVAPRAMHEMCAAALAGDAKRAIALNQRLMGLHQKLFVEANPIPVKWALARMGRIGEGIRLPLTPLAPAFHETVTGALREAGCLS